MGVSEHDPAAPTDATQALEQLGRLALRDQSMEGLLLTVARTATAVLPGAAEASVCLLIDDRPTTPVFTGRLAMDLDESQYGHGHGPCLHAAGSGEMVLVTDARTETRWADYMQSAVERGSLSSLSVPLPLREGVSGALNIYGLEANAFDEQSRSVAARFGPYAAVAAGNLFEYQTARELAENLQRALESRAVIDQAKGILMERHKLTADQAFQLLAHVSMQANIKVRAVAEHLVRTGDLPRP